MLLTLLLEGLKGLDGLGQLLSIAAVLLFVVVGPILIWSASWAVQHRRSDKLGMRLSAYVVLLVLAVALFLVVTMLVLTLLK